MSAPAGSPYGPDPGFGPGAAGGPVGPGGPGGPSGPGGEGAPPPPQGPGVTPPFTAPPADRNRRGLWIGLGIGALVLILCCVGGIAGFGLLAVGTSRQIQADATKVVRGYLDALENGEYDTAYSYLCSDLKGRVTSTQFAQVQERRPRPVGYDIHQVQIGNAIIVPVDVRYEDGSAALRTFELRQEPGGSELRICRGT
ncbi:hypothetical protein HC031_15285 [Planosporangium thailandense]|uniref:DUF4878 domain-containing protein n=1 Tax=Planosporangium thailandense TaxID=765197 RepID=A0ABX0Y0T7_9ACTN|nr:hypothetical protein [Planosporangium thailandense]NJC71064.1 hypothetical protein [Planosporangium thailandense]